jgi:hypothetical protein
MLGAQKNLQCRNSLATDVSKLTSSYSISYDHLYIQTLEVIWPPHLEVDIRYEALGVAIFANGVDDCRYTCIC